MIDVVRKLNSQQAVMVAAVRTQSACQEIEFSYKLVHSIFFLESCMPSVASDQICRRSRHAVYVKTALIRFCQRVLRNNIVGRIFLQGSVISKMGIFFRTSYERLQIESAVLSHHVFVTYSPWKKLLCSSR